MNLKFKIKKQQLKRIDSESPVQKSVNFLNSSYLFDDSWTDLSKKAIFKTEKNNYITPIQNNKCLIPWEVLTGDGFLVSIVGIKQNEDLLITTNKVFVNLKQTNYPDKITKQSPPPPLPEFLQEELEC